MSNTTFFRGIICKKGRNSLELNPRKKQFRLVFTSLERSVILQKLNKLDEFANGRSIAGLQIQHNGSL